MHISKKNLLVPIARDYIISMRRKLQLSRSPSEDISKIAQSTLLSAILHYSDTMRIKLLHAIIYDGLNYENYVYEA